MLTPSEELEAACLEMLEYFEGAMDVDDGDYGEPQANREMQLYTTLRKAMQSQGWKVD